MNTKTASSSRRVAAFRKTALALGVAAMLAPPVSLAKVRAAAAPAGAEFRVNTFTTDNQQQPDIAIDASGDFVVTWDSFDQDGDSYGVYAQRYNATGAMQGAEFLVNSHTTGMQGKAVTAMDADGDFVVVWESSGQDGDGLGIYAQRYDATGAAQGGEFPVNTYTTDGQGDAAVAMDADGDFVVVWKSEGQDGSCCGVYGQRFDATGAAQGGEFQVNTYTSDSQGFPAVAMDDDGDFVVSWHSYGQNGYGYSVYARRYDSAGVPQGAEFLVNTSTEGLAQFPDVAMDADGDFAVTWQDYSEDGLVYGIYARRFNAMGVAQGGQFRVNARTDSLQLFPAIAMDDDGDFVVSWMVGGPYGDGDSYGVHARRFNALGSAQSGDFRINSTTTGVQFVPAIAMDADGDFVVGWSSFQQDSSFMGVYAQRYAPTPPTDLSLGVMASPTSLATDGAPVSYTFTVGNLGSASATGVTIDTALPEGFVYTGASGTGWTCSDLFGAVRCESSMTLAAAGSDSVTIDAIGGGIPGLRPLSAFVWAHPDDPDTANNEASADVTVATDTVPNAFSFPNRRDVPTTTWIESSLVIPVGFNAAASIAMLGAGEYSIDGGAWTATPGTIAPGQTLRLRQLTPAQVNRENQVKVNVGGTVAGFRIRTRSFAGDTDPDAFNFNNSPNQPLNTLVQSKPYMPVGYDTAAPISVTGGEYSIDGGAYTSISNMVNPGSTLRVRTTTPGTNDTKFEVNLQIGTTRAKWIGKTVP